MSITVTLPDGKQLELPDGATGADAAAAIGPGLARAALAVELIRRDDGDRAEVRDLARPLPDGARVAILTDKSGPPALELIRHDAAHVLAAAVMDLSFATQALCVEELVGAQGRLERRVLPIPADIDREIARLKLDALGVEIDELTAEQRAYLEAWDSESGESTIG